MLLVTTLTSATKYPTIYYKNLCFLSFGVVLIWVSQRLHNYLHKYTISPLLRGNYGRISLQSFTSITVVTIQLLIIFVKLISRIYIKREEFWRESCFIEAPSWRQTLFTFPEFAHAILVVIFTDNPCAAFLRFTFQIRILREKWPETWIQRPRGRFNGSEWIVRPSLTLIVGRVSRLQSWEMNCHTPNLWAVPGSNFTRPQSVSSTL